MSFRLRLPPKVRPGELFDVVIIGGGPAGLSAALYAARFSLRAVLVADSVGGTLNDAGVVDDYIGIPDILGPDLAKKFEAHVVKYGVPVVVDRVVGVAKSGEHFEVHLQNSGVIRCISVIVAVGSVRRKLGVPGEDRLRGRGVTYCAPCDAPMFKDRVVAVVGGGNAALQGALLTASYASKVYLIHRRDSFRAFPQYVDLVKKNSKIELVLNSVVEEIGGGERVEWVRVRNVVSGEERELRVSGVVVEIGSEPPREFLRSMGLELDEYGYVVVYPGQKTNIEGVFAAGDCTGGPYKKKFDQIVTAAAEGAIAAYSVYEFVISRRGGEYQQAW
ncbi:MAG: FAD-dependent oxidoreductase [Sulfolobales archaeon]|nr:FAD-dependent oxidoreductase [Sulfolobales archaeon]MCX8208389.1 FAD-dependent oxidoreductase [Sulfolobales archaeon]MDW8010717.1 FAD-dependent oxidoreductase [Sulfolobales archaeon]